MIRWQVIYQKKIIKTLPSKNQALKYKKKLHEEGLFSIKIQQVEIK